MKFTIFPNQEKDKISVPVFRWLFSGSPSVGKTNTIFNIIVSESLKGNPFMKIYVLHLNPDSTEYNMIDHIKITDIPPLSEYEEDVRTLIIIEDLNFKALSKKQTSDLYNLLKHDSSHFGVSVFITTQVLTLVPISLRRCFNQYLVWKSIDKRTYQILDQIFGKNSGYFCDCFSRLTSKYDFICVDDGYRVYKNLDEEI